MHLLTSLLTLFFFLTVGSSSDFTPSRLPAIPLIVRSPYLSTWITSPEKTLYGSWPTFWNGKTKGMAGIVRVDEEAYEFMGQPMSAQPGKNVVVQEKVEYTATQTKFTMVAANVVRLDINFLSPVEPDNHNHQSIPASYISIIATSLDGKSHKVQVYIDLTAEWVSGNNSEVAAWKFEQLVPFDCPVSVHNFYLQNPKPFQEIDDQAEWGTHKFFTGVCRGMTYQSGNALDLRKQFIDNGVLKNTQDTEFRKINDRWPAFAFAKDLGSVDASPSSPVVFGVAHVRNPAIEVNYGQVSYLPPLWKQYYSDEEEMIIYFYSTFEPALRQADSFDSALKGVALKVGGPAYLPIVYAATRQAFGGIEFVSGLDNEPWLMLKEISSDGNCQTTDVLYPHFPIQYFLNPLHIKMLLQPLFIYQERGLYSHKFAMHDLGASYPRCIGQPLGEPMEVEESANMIIMTAAYVQASGDGLYARDRYPMLKQWAKYLETNGLFPGDALTTDDFLGRIKNATNLSLKAIVGLAAMSKLASSFGNKSEAMYYDAISKNYSSIWVKYAQDPTGKHTKLGYGNNGTWSMLYNLFADKLLKTNVIPQSIVDEMDAWYLSVAQKYGVPLEYGQNKQSINWSKGDWSLFQASASNATVRNMMIQKLANWLNETNSRVPFSDWMDVVSGNSSGFANRPVIGGVFAPLAVFLAGN